MVALGVSFVPRPALLLNWLGHGNPEECYKMLSQTTVSSTVMISVYTVFIISPHCLFLDAVPVCICGFLRNSCWPVVANSGFRQNNSALGTEKKQKLLAVCPSTVMDSRMD